MEARLLDRNNYSVKTNETYEILSAYYVDIFYNHLYTEAKKLKAQSSVSSITEGYKHTLNAFLKGLNNPKLYKKSLVGIHHYFINIGLASITFSRCVDKITSEFIPTDYFMSLTSTQKMGVLRMVINQSIKQFIKKIVDEHMVKIIDNHTDSDNVRILQDVLIDCFIMEREGMYQRFIASQTTTNGGSSVNLILAEKMQLEIKKLVKEKYTYLKQINLLTKAFNLQKIKEKKNQDIIAKLKRQISNESYMNNRSSQLNNKYDNQIQFNKSDNNLTHLSNNKHEFKRLEGVNLTESSYVEKDKFEKDKFENDKFENDKFEKDKFEKDKFEKDKFEKDKFEKISVIHDRSPHQKSELSTTPTKSVLENLKENNTNLDIQLSPTLSENFIEVNLSNMENIINGDSEYLQQLSDSCIFNDKMDEETTLDDFN
jgi:hypothetical protein